MVRVRFAPSPTGSLHLGGALTAAANRRFADTHGGTLLLRIDDTDATRRDPEAEGAIVADLGWLGIRWEEGPVRQSERADRYRQAARQLLDAGTAYEEDGAVRFGEERRPTIIRPDGTATYHLASVVDDLDFGITHVIRGRDHLPNTTLHRGLARALGGSPPEYVHHGLLLAPEGGKLSKRHGSATVAGLREAGFPAEAVRAYLDELGLPASDVILDEPRLKRLSTDVIQRLPAEELAAHAGVPSRVAPALRGAHTLLEARELGRLVRDRPLPPQLAVRGRLTLERLLELREPLPEAIDEVAAREMVRELKAVGGDLRALRLALIGRESGPELWTLLVALPRDEARERCSAALAGVEEKLTDVNPHP